MNFGPYTLTQLLTLSVVLLLQSLVQSSSNTALWIHGDHRVNAVAINIKDLVDAATNVGGRQEEMRRATCINNTNANSPATQQPNVLYLLGFHFVTVVPERGRKSEGDKRSS